MKKLINKIQRKKPEEEAAPSRITNETVAEHREQILAGGRKFKYPVQYVKHKLVLNSLLIVVGAVVVLSIGVWYLLYHVQLDTKFMYRLTQLVPVPVANIDGQNVLYSDFLKKYRSDIFSLVSQEQITPGSADAKRQSEYYKRKELTSAERDAYAIKLARENNVTVSRAEVDAFISASVNSKSISLEAYEKTVLRNFYDWSLDEYRGIVKARLLERKVGFVIDKNAQHHAEALRKRLTVGDDFAAVAMVESDDIATKASGGDAGVLSMNNHDPNGLIAAAKRMTDGQTSKLIQGSDGYYIIKLNKKTNDTVHFSQIKVSLSEFDKRFEAVKKAGKIKEYIEVTEG